MKRILCLLVLIFAKVSSYSHYIVPEDQYAVKCPSQPCTTINYLLNVTFFNISNTEFYFLPGIHQLNVNMVVTYAQNVSFIGLGSLSPGVLQCLGETLLNITNSANVVVSNLVFKDCGGYQSGPEVFNPNISCLEKNGYFTNLLVSSCSNVSIMNISFLNYTGYGVVGISVTSMFHLDNILLNVPEKMHSDMRRCNRGVLVCLHSENNLPYGNNSQIVISRLVCNSNRDDLCSFDSTIGLKIFLYDLPFDVFVSIVNSSFIGIRYLEEPILSINIHTYKYSSLLVVKNCYLSSNKQITYFHRDKPVIKIEIPHRNATIILQNITFFNNSFTDLLILVDQGYFFSYGFHYCTIMTNVSLIDLTFTHNIYTKLIKFRGIPELSYCLINVVVSGFLNIYNNVYVFHDGLITVQHMVLYVRGIILISHSDALNLASIIYLDSSIMAVYGDITFLSNICREVIRINSLQYPYIVILENATIMFKSNECSHQLITIENKNNPYPYCIFQYFTDDGGTIPDSTRLFFNLQRRYSITFIDNIQHISNRRKSTINYYTSHCRWLDGAAFNRYDPKMINKMILNIKNSAKQGLSLGHHVNLCYCPHNGTHDCTVDVLGEVYPGQTIQVDMCAPYLNGISVMFADTYNTKIQNWTCRIANQNQLTNVIRKKYKAIKFTVISNSTKYCSLFLTTQPTLNNYYDVFHILVLPCPIGFTLQNEICNCDPILVSSSLKISTCYINELAIERPASSWIYHKVNTSNYQMSSHCPLDYCHPHIIKLNLALPNSQCQFCRTGLLCSQCQTNLSMVFGSSRCMKCTNTYLLLTMAVLVAGIVLVLSLYYLHLTVTKGTISGMIFYANVISINDSVFLANSYTHSLIKTFISLANLDLGIEICFYDGMDSYVKMWLHLFFPFYLIALASLLILASRYSTRIQRLIYARSLPVLATLFLLSYTGILRNVSTVLFSYSTITELPSNYQHLVWSIDASVPLFGVKFTILFITCLILFVALIPFNMTLLFTRQMMRFRIISRFKPIVDAFQGSYKDRHNYWMAVYIILRNIFFALYVLPAESRLIISTIILILLISLFGYIFPNKNLLVNIQEFLLLINLTIIYAISYQSRTTISSTVTNVMIGIALFHFIIIILFHFLTFTCCCDVENMLWMVKEKIARLCYSSTHPNCKSYSLQIPERTYNYTEYREGLVTDDFAS